MIDVEQKKAKLYVFLAELEQDIKILQDNILKVKEDVKAKQEMFGIQW